MKKSEEKLDTSYGNMGFTVFKGGIKFIYSLEGHKILQNLHQLFVLCTASQIFGGDFVKFCGLLRIYEL